MLNMQLLITSSLSLVMTWGAGQVDPETSPHYGASARPLLTSVQSANDGTLASVRRSDDGSRGADKKLLRLTTSEHIRRANIYMTNRAFDEAREHWQALIDYYPQEAKVPEALLGIGRSYLQSRRHAEAVATFNRLVQDYGSTKEGREGLNFSAAALLRMGKPSDAADKYAEYIDRFPHGERIDTAHLNVIDTLREAGRPQEAIAWVARTRQRFSGTPTDTNALFARLRLDIAEGDWEHAVLTVDELSRKRFQRGVLTTPSEVAYLKAYSLERAGKRREAFAAYLAIPDAADSYYGWLAAERLDGLAEGPGRNLVKERSERAQSQIANAAAQYPHLIARRFLKLQKRANSIHASSLRSFVRRVCSVQRRNHPPAREACCRLTIDAARRYAPGAGISNLGENELYRPETSILVGGEYLADLARMFPNMLEAVAASYNGGEDNVARWVKRAKHKDPGVFTAEIGFEETKGYVQKVMTNYRAYRQLYTADLIRR